MKPIRILHVEDSEGDILLIHDAIEETGLAYHIDVAANGEEALRFLQKKDQFYEGGAPDLIFLDLNMPLMNGYEFLDIIKADPALKHIPVIILTTSSSRTDILKSYDKYCNCYITKPDSAFELEKVIKSIENFWFTVAELPTNSMSQD